MKSTGAISRQFSREIAASGLHSQQVEAEIIITLSHVGPGYPDPSGNQAFVTAGEIPGGLFLLVS